MFAALGIVSAILSARASGQGQVIDVAMVDGVANLMALIHEMLGKGMWRDERAANLLDGAAPFYRCYACADGGHVAVGAIEPQFFAQLLAGLEIDPAGVAQHDRARWPELTAEFARVFATRTRDEWEARFAGTDACVAPVLSMTEAMAHPVNVERQVFVERDGIGQAAPAPRFSVTPGAISESKTVSIEDAIAAWGD